MDQKFTNPDIAPVPPHKRTWTTLHFFSLWVGMAVCIPTYMIAASLISGGMNWSQAILTVLLGNVIVLVPMILNGHAGVKYGIPYPVLARASFGVLGSNIPALCRAVVACGWFGIQCWIGGAAISSILLAVWPGAATFASLPFVCFLVFWAINMYYIWNGVESIKGLETMSAPFLIVAGLALLAWAVVRADGFGPIFAAPSVFTTRDDFWTFFVPALTGMVGFWATLSLNIPDFTRYARDQKSQVWGQALGLPTTMTLFAFIGIAVTSATVVVFGEAMWDPVMLVRKFDSPLLVVLAMFAVVIATLTTNVAANVVGPANDFSNLAPSRISFRTGGVITGIIGIVMQPWKLLADPTGYIFTWLIGYSALLGPIAGILLVDYYLLRRRRLVVEDLYRAGGRYWYRGGVNPTAIVALLCGVLPNLPGFLAQIGVITVAPDSVFVSLYHYAWFLGFALSSVSYYGLTLLSRPAVEWETAPEN